MIYLWYYAYLCSLILLLALLGWFCLYCQKCNKYWLNKGVPTLSPKLFFGNVKNVLLLKEGILKTFDNFYTTMRQNGERFGGFYFFTRPVFIIFDLNLINRVLVQDFNYFVDRPVYCNEERDPLSAHLFSLKGENWKQLRTKLTPAFTLGKLKMMFDDTVSVCDKFATFLEKKVENDDGFDVNEELNNVMSDIIALNCFGLSDNSTEESNSELKRYGKEYLVDPSFWQSIDFLIQAFIPEFFYTLKIRAHSKKMTNFFINLVRDIAKFREDNNVVRRDLMHILLQIKNDVKIDEDSLGNVKSEVIGRENLSVNKIAAQSFAFFLAGFDATSLALSFCIYEFSINNTLQDKAREEVIRTLKNNKITYNSIQEMKFLSMCLHESFRKYPSALGNIRVCTKDYKIPNSTVVLDKGTIVIIPILSIQNDPKYYPNPKIFDPERFSNDNKANRHSCSWLPFGQGPRACIGYPLAYMQMKILLATLLTRYKFSLHHATRIPIKFNDHNVLVVPSSKILVNLEKL